MREKAIKKPNGRPTTLTPEIFDAVVSSVRKYLSITNAAEVNGQSRNTVQSWIRRGYEDSENGGNSVFANFATAIKKARAEKIQDYLEELQAKKTNWQAIAWILERVCAEDFGKDAELYRQLLEDYKMLAQAIVDQNKGITHGSQTANTKA